MHNEQGSNHWFYFITEPVFSLFQESFCFALNTVITQLLGLNHRPLTPKKRNKIDSSHDLSYLEG